MCRVYSEYIHYTGSDAMKLLMELFGAGLGIRDSCWWVRVSLSVGRGNSSSIHLQVLTMRIMYLSFASCWNFLFLFLRSYKKTGKNN